MKKPIFVIDADGIVYDSEGYAMQKVNKKYGTTYTGRSIKNYGVTNDRLINEKFGFYSDPEFVNSQPLYEGAQEFISELQKECDVIFCTAVAPECATVRINALKRDFGVDDRHIIITSRKDLVVGDFFLDDCPANVRDNRSRYPILFRQPWNEDVSGVLSVTKYEDVLAFVRFVTNPRPFTGTPKKGSIICLVGPTGSGKNAIVDEVSGWSGYRTIQTYSTSDNSRYHHLSDEEFAAKEDAGFFAEYTVYGRQKYGISKESILNTPDDANIILPVDMCGAISLKNIFGDRVTIVFVDANKSELISKTLDKDCSREEKSCRLQGIDAELANRQFCDLSVKNADELKKFII